MQLRTLLYKLALALTIVGSLIILYFTCFKTGFNDYSFKLDTDLASDLGDLLGGLVGPIFSLAGVFLLFETLRLQRLTFQKQQFENKFFEFLKIYRDNVSEMSHTPNGKDESVIGRRVFIEIRKQFGIFYNIITDYAKKTKVDLAERDIVNITYIIVFFGLGETSTELVKHYLSKNYSKYSVFIDNIINSQALKGRCDGHQSRLGHYFRHLFQMVKYIDNEEHLTPDDKYFYVKTIRAQLSTYELTIFFFNSLSDFGKPWSQSNNNLIEKYHFIKNIPLGFTFGIDPKKYYPKVKYEYDELNVISS